MDAANCRQPRNGVASGFKDNRRHSGKIKETESIIYARFGVGTLAGIPVPVPGGIANSGGKRARGFISRPGGIQLSPPEYSTRLVSRTNAMNLLMTEYSSASPSQKRSIFRKIENVSSNHNHGRTILFVSLRSVTSTTTTLNNNNGWSH